MADETVVGTDDGLMEIGVFHKAPIDEEIVVGGLLPGTFGFADKTGDCTHGRMYLDGQ